jgi:hypothetical protein
MRFSHVVGTFSLSVCVVVDWLHVGVSVVVLLVGVLMFDSGRRDVLIPSLVSVPALQWKAFIAGELSSTAGTRRCPQGWCAVGWLVVGVESKRALALLLTERHLFF